PLVGRDLLLGILGGIGTVLLTQAVIVVPQLLNLPPPVPAQSALGPPPPRLYLLAVPLGATYYALLWFALAFLLALVLRREGLAWAGFVAFFILVSTLIFAPPSLPGAVAYALSNMLILGLWVFLMKQFGLLAFAAALVAQILLLVVPLTWDAAAWYFREGLLGACVVVALAVYGFVTRVAGPQVPHAFPSP